MKQQQCAICSSQRGQVKILLTSLRSRIIRQSHQYVPDYKEEEPDKENTDGFSRLLVLIFGHTATSHSSFSNCPHTKFSRYFRRKLKCDNPTFNSLCSEIANKIAERNYQLETLSLQIGSSAKTSGIEAENPLADIIVKKINEERQQHTKTDAAITNLSSRQGINEGPLPLEALPVFWMPQPTLIHFPWLFREHQHHN